jgi:hypothetical protein
MRTEVISFDGLSATVHYRLGQSPESVELLDATVKVEYESKWSKNELKWHLMCTSLVCYIACAPSKSGRLLKEFLEIKIPGDEETITLEGGRKVKAQEEMILWFAIKNVEIGDRGVVKITGIGDYWNV